jgi:hypothetical protein
MVDLALLQSLSYIAGALGVCVAAFYYVTTLRTQQETMKHTLETRQTQIFMELFKTFASKEFMQDLEELMLHWEFIDHTDFYRKYSSKVDPLQHAKFDFFLNYFDGIGILVERKLIDPDLVYSKMRYGLMAFWEKYEPVVAGDRLALKTPKLFSNYEYLYNQVKPLRESETSDKIIYPKDGVPT